MPTKNKTEALVVQYPVLLIIQSNYFPHHFSVLRYLVHEMFSQTEDSRKRAKTHETEKNCAVLGCYAASSGNSLSKFQDKSFSLSRVMNS